MATFLKIFIAVACLGLPACASADGAESKATFLEQVQVHFPAWDLNDNGELSVNEIELAVHDPNVHGVSAAAAVALRRAVRAHKDLGPLSLKKITGGVQTKSTKEVSQPAYESHFRSAVKEISTAKKDIFLADAPRIENISQGHLGDCFLLVSLGSCAYREPERLKRMMQPAAEGKVLITLGGERSFELTAPTDAEMTIGATSRGSGTWAGVYEKAIGTVMLERHKSGRHVTPLSLIGVGGSPHMPLEIFTGHKIRRHGCEGYREPKEEGGASAADLTPLREDLKAAFANGKLIVGGCGPIGSQTIVKGLYYNHSYGVLDYSVESDTVLFWNPFGNKFTPKGPDGLEFGYTTEHGKFRVPLKEAVTWFGSFSIETDESPE